MKQINEYTTDELSAKIEASKAVLEICGDGLGWNLVVIPRKTIRRRQYANVDTRVRIRFL